MNNASVGRGASFLFLETSASMLFAYAFWFIMSKFTSSEAVGTASYLVSLSVIFSIVAGLGVPFGVQRFLGRIFSQQKIQESSIFIKASLALVIIGVLACIAAVLITRSFFPGIFKTDEYFTLVFMVLFSSTAINTLLRSIIISSLKTRILLIISIVTGTLKIIVSIILISIGVGSLGIIIGFTLYPSLGAIFILITLVPIIRKSKVKTSIKFRTSMKETLSGSLPNWVPSLMATLASQLGTILIFGYKGASNAGIYFMAINIYLTITTVTSVLLSISFSALSAMDDGRKRFTWRITKLSLIITLPISSSLIFYSKDVMNIFGWNYVDGTLSLQILLISTLPTIVTSGINLLVYSRGNYRQVLVIGLASSMPRTILYFILIPLYGGPGAAISFTIGSIIGLVVSIVFARKIGLQIFWKDLFLILMIPAGLGSIFNYAEITYIIGIPIISIASYLLFLKIRIIRRVDIHDSVSVLPSKIANPVLRIINTLAVKLDKQY